MGGIKFTPITGDALTYAPGQNVNVFYQIWSPPADPKSFGARNLTVDYAYGRVGASGDAHTLHEEVAKSQFDVFGSMLTGKKIALPMEAAGGNYRLLVSLNDPDSTQKVYSSLNFRVFSQGGAAPPFDITDPDLAQDVSKGVPQFDRALAYLAQGDKSSALTWFKAALARNPSNEIARSRLAELYFAKQDYASVAELFSRSPVTPETDEQAILQGAESMAKTGSVNRAISLLEGAINQRNKSGPLYMALAGYYRSEGNADKATELETKGRELIRE
jgi:tetratricopeptide (TPR) repeat protein